MSNIIPVDDIKEKANIIEYMLIHYPKLLLKRHGHVYQGFCPFHKENSPSFTIWPNGTYKCFGCGEYGDIFTFVMKKENLDFKEACKLVADNVGVAYELEPPNPAHEAYKEKMNEHVRRYWRNLLATPDALNYLKKERGLTDATIQNFRIGYVPADEFRYRSDIGGIAERLAFPILENKSHTTAKCIAMGYRTLKDELPKYKNDSNKDQDNDPLKGVYIKGNSLYGYSLAFQEIRRLNHVIVTEGYIDVASLHQSGITNSLSPLGTALTESQAAILRKLTDNITLFFDGDNAGISNMFRVVPMLLEIGFNVNIIIAKKEQDAADICKDLNFCNHDVQEYIDKNSKSAMSVIIEHTTSDYERIVLAERLKAVKALSPFLDKIPNASERDIFRNMLYKRLDMSNM